MSQSAFHARRSFFELILLELRVIFFCAYKEELVSFGKREFFFSMLLVLLAGLGRVWHTAGANWVLAPLTSWGYVLCLGMYLWVLFALIGARDWRFGRLLTFIGMTAPVGWLHAIPIEQMCGPYEAERANLIISLIVTGWRIALLAWFTGQTASLTPMRIAVSLFLPLTLIMNLIVWSDDVSTGLNRLGGIRRQLRRQTQNALTNQFSATGQFGSQGGTETHQFGASPASGASAQSAHPGTSRSRHKAVTSAPTAWLSNRGAQLAQQQDSPGLQMNILKPTHTETINTPQGPVEIFSDVTIGGAPNPPIPDGFEEVPPDDAIYQYKNPLAKLLRPLALICLWGAVPAGFAYLVYIFCRPKRIENEETSDEDENDEEE